MDFRNTGHSEGYSRRRAEFSRGKRVVQSDSYLEMDDQMEDVKSPRDMREEEEVDTIIAEELNILRILLNMKGGGTIYPDRDTMERLVIAADVDNMLNNWHQSIFVQEAQILQEGVLSLPSYAITPSMSIESTHTRRK